MPLFKFDLLGHATIRLLLLRHTTIQIHQKWHATVQIVLMRHAGIQNHLMRHAAVQTGLMRHAAIHIVTPLGQIPVTVVCVDSLFLGPPRQAPYVSRSRGSKHRMKRWESVYVGFRLPLNEYHIV
jgi:hypothetical protein